MKVYLDRESNFTRLVLGTYMKLARQIFEASIV